ncbi:hypothetical protein SAMN02745751_02968 [Dethiosulfatibacter aminovorans DSM 17477]|uniref:Uncharacterized protein n=1 Tax=Dethiosulfatibacter aminovorans DSM 17477 TaxID=1121476 RepID=A0A1M6KSS5_9FIRM|nr:hypothetical protein [Dethiosulfatibacter aminovorans]SHJ61952.1 hypothetical protein SAMN02745751_02968 [Dethiosulfatibacter aminovorans DSM 17477]
MNRNRMRFVVAAIFIVLSILLIITKKNNLVRYYNYVAENNDNDIVYTYNDELLNLKLRWINEEITKGPYSLFLSVEVEDNEINSVYIENIDIVSSTEVNYKFSSDLSEPLSVYDVEKRDNHIKYSEETDSISFYQFEDSFNFDFEGNEDFLLKLKLRCKGQTIDEVRLVEVNYKPYVDEVYAPIL